MNQSKRFADDWEPSLLAEEILAEGIWWYDGRVPYSIILKRQKFDYTSADLETLEHVLHEIHMDYPDHAINADGEIYVWCVQGPSGKSQSKSLSSLEEAKRHVETYGRVELHWLAISTESQPQS